MTKHILCAVDLSHPETEARLLREAARLATFYGAALSVISVIPDYGMTIVGSYFPEGTMRKAVKDANQRLHDFVRETLPDFGPVQHILETGSAYEQILRAASTSDVDLIVVGAHKPDMIERIQGPNSARIARKASCSVLVIRD